MKLNRRAIISLVGTFGGAAILLLFLFAFVCRENSSKQTLSYGTLIVLSGLKIGRTNIYSLGRGFPRLSAAGRLPTALRWRVSSSHVRLSSLLTGRKSARFYRLNFACCPGPHAKACSCRLLSIGNTGSSYRATMVFFL